MPVLCAICGVNPSTTKDHVPPKSLYPKPRDNNLNLHTVPACAHCNNGASQDDEVFKMLVGIDTGEHQDSPQKVIDSLAGTIAKNSRVAGQVFSTQKRVLAKLGGAVLEPAISVTFDFQPYERVINRIVRGLHWKETRRVFASDARVVVLPGNQIQPSLAADLMQLMHLLPLRKLNKGTFLYRFHIGNDGSQLWGMQFFSKHTTFALVDRSSGDRADA